MIPTWRKILWAMIIGGLVGFAATTSYGCGSIGLKQQAVITLNGSEAALEAAHDAERLVCSPTANQAAAITHCDGPLAVQLGLTDAKHQALARAFSVAFEAQAKAAIVLQAWRAGDPAPASVSEYHQDVSDVLALVAQVFPTTHTVTTDAQQAVDKAAAILTTLGVQ